MDNKGLVPKKKSLAKGSHLVHFCLHLSVRVLSLRGQTVVGNFLVHDVFLGELGDRPPLGNVGLHHRVEGHRLLRGPVVDGDAAHGARATGPWVGHGSALKRNIKSMTENDANLHESNPCIQKTTASSSTPTTLF